jgi:hypothetical protein
MVLGTAHALDGKPAEHKHPARSPLQKAAAILVLFIKTAGKGRWKPAAEIQEKLTILPRTAASRVMRAEKTIP